MKVFRRFLRSLALGLTAFVTQGCYYIQQGWTLISTYSQSKAVEEVLAQGDLNPEERAFLEETLRIRTFAVEELGLKSNKNYTGWVRIDRPYLALVVSASAADRFEQHLWHHPFVGAMPYQGYFDKEGAEKEAQRLRDEGLDVSVRPVDAFSTLGWFQDPLFSYMAQYTKGQTADLLIHEQTHATVWVNGQAEFNENLALFVGQKGAAEYLEKFYGADSLELVQYQQNQERNRSFYRLFAGLHQQLSALYESPPQDGSLLVQKAALIAQFKASLPLELAHWKEREINNALLMGFQTYTSRLDEIRAFYEGCGKSLKKMMTHLKGLGGDVQPWEWIKNNFPADSP